MTRFRSSVGAVLVASVVAAGAAFAQGPRPVGPGGPGGHGVGRGTGLPLASLNLTQAQQDLVRDIRERGREGSQPIAAKLQAARQAQRRAVSAIPLDEAAIRSATMALAELEAEAAIQQARVQNEIFAALTPEQQEQMKASIAARQARVEQRQGQAVPRRTVRQ